MDLVGKMFRNSIRILRVNGILGKHEEGSLYNCSFLDKGLNRYIVAHHARYREENIIKYFSEYINTDIISKAEHMLNINYLACCSLVNNIEFIKSSDYHIKVLNYSIIIKGPYTAIIFPNYICIEPSNTTYGDIHLYKSIAEEDYYKILFKVKKLKEDLDKLWTDVV